MTCKEMKSAMVYTDHKMYKKLRIRTDIGKLKILPVNGGEFYSSGYAGHGVEYPLPTESNANRVQLENWEKTYSYYFNKALRHHIGRREVWERTNGGRKTTFSGLKCDEAGWVDIMDFLHHPWIFDHENVRVEDDGLVGIDFREDRVNTMIKTVWSEFQEKNNVRIQFLCIVLDSTFDKPDDYLKNVMKVDDDIHKLIAQRGEVFLAPIAVRSPGGFSAQGNDFRLDYSRICHPITTRIADDLCFCYHVTEFKNVIGIIKEGLRPGGHRGGRTQVFLNPFVPWDKRYKDILGGQLTHLGQPRMVLAFSVHRPMSLGVMINASGQMVISGNIPFSEVIAAWYQANTYEWERLLVDSGKFQLVRSCQEPKEIATANTVLRVSKTSEMENEDQDEIDRLVRESKRTTGETFDDDVDMTDAKASREQTRSGSDRERTAPDQKIAFGSNTKEQQEEEDERVAQEQEQDEEQREAKIKLPLWTARTIQASIIQCIDIAQNEDAIDSTARAVDGMILTYLKDLYKLYNIWTSMAPAQQYYDHVKKIKLLPEFDGYIPYVGEHANGELKEPTEEQLIASFHANAKGGKIGGRDLEVYLKGVNGIKVLCKIMKYLVQTGITPQLIYSKIADVTNDDEERQQEIRREASDFIRKIISGAFAVRSYDYFRVTPPQRNDHIHIDPVELACAVTERSRTFTVLVTLNKIGLALPQQLQRIWQGKLKAVNQSAAQMEASFRSIDPSERENARDYVRALADAQATEERASSSTKESSKQKKRRKE